MREIQNTVYLLTPGTQLHLDGDAIRVTRTDTPGRHLIPLARVDTVVLHPGTSITDALIRRLGQDGKPASWITGNGRVQARTSGPTLPNPLLRLDQYRAHTSPATRHQIAAAIVEGKIRNTRQLILRAARDRAPEPPAAELRATAESLHEDTTRIGTTTTLNELLGIEGSAARRYVQAWTHLITSNAKIARPTRRSKRPAHDLFNAALNYGYALLRVSVTGALEATGLDPHIGFLHSTRPSRPSLALDLMEEFRAPMVDRLVLNLVNRQQLTDKHGITTPTGLTQLTDEGRKLIVTAWSDARREETTHPATRTTTPRSLLPLVQARILARHIRGDLPTYTPWIWN